MDTRLGKALERTETERAFALDEATLTLLDGETVGHWVYDATASRLVWSDRVCALFELDRPISTADYWQAVHPEDRAIVEHAVAEALRSNGSYTVEHRVSRGDGWRWVRCHGRVLERDGAYAGTLGTVVDITEGRLAREALRKEEARARTMVENLPIGYAIHQDQVLVYANQAAARILRVGAPESLVGRSVWDFIYPARIEQAHARRRIVELGEIAPLSQEIWRGEDDRPVHVSTISIPTEFEGRDSVQVAFIDQTDRHDLEMQLQHSQRLESLGRLAGGIAHDFNNLLTAILGNLDAAERQQDDPRGRDAVRAIRAASERAALITSQLLAFARRQVVEPRIVDVGEAVRNAQHLLRQIVGESVSVTLQVPEGPQPVRIDPAQLEQLLVNLASNAGDAMPSGGRLTIQVETRHVEGTEPGRFVCLTVTDNGTGIEEALQKLIFEPFFTTKDPSSGSGLGLSTCLGIAQQNGGTIDVQSTPGEGTRFTVSLPHTSEPVDLVPPHEQGLAQGRESVLVLEDETMVLEVARDGLEQAGFKVLSASDAEEALALADGLGALDAMVSDIVLPNASGIDVAEQLRGRFPDLCVLFVSGYPAEQLSERDLKTPRTAFLQKPYRASGLARALRSLLDRS